MLFLLSLIARAVARLVASSADDARNLCFELDQRETPVRILILGRRHLDHVLASYACRYNAQRPHRGIELRVPSSPSHIDPVTIVPEIIRRRDLLGRLIHDYHAVAA